MITKNKILVAIVIVVLIGAGIWVGMNLNNSASGPSPYSVVVMSSGEVLFGKLSWFPAPHLTDAWTLQQTQDENKQTRLSVVPVKSALWSPVDEIYLNSSQIISWARLSKDSSILKALEGQATDQNQSQLPAGSPATSTFRGPSSPPPSR